ncbi:MAG: phosphoadenosine phosphosulfate reductase family protein [Salinarchaeum sp.]
MTNDQLAREDDYRKRAPGRPGDHPDWFWSLSGGIDSTAALILTREALDTSNSERDQSNYDGNFAKKPVAIYLDTRIGVPLNRLYVEQLCDYFDVQLWTLRTDESFLEWLRRDGAPGPGAHGNVRNELKNRQSSKLTSLADNPVFVLGLSADESPNRAAMSKVVEKRRHVEVLPVHRLSLKKRAEVILRSDIPRNPLWSYPEVIKDCGCSANGDPSEKEKTIELFPEFGQWLREWEEAIEHEFPKDTLGWGGLTSDEYAARRDGFEQATLSTCGSGFCQRERDPAVVRAFKADATGASVEEAVSILHGSKPDPKPEVVA